MTAPTNPTASITNNLGFDVDIYDVFNSNPDGKMGGALTYTKLAIVPEGAKSQQVKTIRSTSTLQAMRTGNITALNSNYYQQFPVAGLNVNKFLADVFTLSPDMQQSMEQSFKFIKYSTANPTSALAKDFATALSSKTSTADVNKFFQGTGSFKLCTMSSWTTVFNWQAQFTNAWQGTYYLYSLGDKASKTVPALVATLVIVSSTLANSAVLTVAKSDNETVNISMVGDGSMQDSSPGSDDVSVSLNPTWMNVAQTSGSGDKTVTKYVIGVVFSGTISGIKVTGNINQMTFPKDTQSEDSKNCKNSCNSFSMNTLFQIAGLLTSMGMLYCMAKEKKNTETKKANEAEDGATSADDARTRRQQSESSSESADSSAISSEVSSTSSSRSSTISSYQETIQAQNAQTQANTINEEAGRLVEVMQVEPSNQQISDAADNLFDTQTDLKDITSDPNKSVTERGKALSTNSTKIETVGTNLQKQLANGTIQVSNESKKSLDRTIEATAEQKAQNDAKEEAEKEKQKEEQKTSEDEVNEDNFDNQDETGEGGEVVEGGGFEGGGFEGGK